VTRLQSDFLGPFVECNGAINRPPAATSLNLDGPIVGTNIRYTPRVRVRDDAGREEHWHNCGDASAYREARKTLPRAEFERFAAMACAPEFAYNGAARALYPQMAKLIPPGPVDYLGKDWQEHDALSKTLSQAWCDRRNAAYQAKRGGSLPAHAGPAPVQLRVSSAAQVLDSIRAAAVASPASTPASALAPPRRRVRP
jgi:hypothetical protein